MNITSIGPVKTSYRGYGRGYSYGIDLFSGNKVVDWKNESGFLTDSLARQAGLERKIGLMQQYGISNATNATKAA